MSQNTYNKIAKESLIFAQAKAEQAGVTLAQLQLCKGYGKGGNNG